MVSEPEIKFTEEEMCVLNKLVSQTTSSLFSKYFLFPFKVNNHDERYRSVNFGEQLIKEMIMCR